MNIVHTQSILSDPQLQKTEGEYDCSIREYLLLCIYVA